MEKWVVFFNVESFSIWNTPSISLCSETVKTLLGRYPEHLGHAIVWQAPSLFWGLYKALSSFLEPATVKKIVFVSGKDTSDGSEVDQQMRALVGDNWRTLCDIDSARGRSVYRVDEYTARMDAEQAEIEAAAENEPTAEFE